MKVYRVKQWPNRLGFDVITSRGTIDVMRHPDGTLGASRSLPDRAGQPRRVAHLKFEREPEPEELARVFFAQCVTYAPGFDRFIERAADMGGAAALSTSTDSS